MKLEVGNYYRTRDGRKVQCNEIDGDCAYLDEQDRICAWADGGMVDTRLQSKNDLIAEWTDEPEVEDDGFITVHSTRATILDTAKQYVTQDRQAAHGKPEETFGLIAAYWSAHLDVPVSSMDVAAMMTLLKLARAKSNPRNADNWVDMAGYAACGGELANG